MLVTSRDGVSVSMWTKGQGRPLLLIHGAGVDAGFFSECSRELANTRLVVAYDRRGYGLSACEADADRSIATQADDALAVMDAVTPDDLWDIVAHSAGSLVALELAARCPERIRSMVLHEPAVLDCIEEGDEALAVLREATQEVQDDPRHWMWPLVRLLSLERFEDKGQVPASREEAARQEANLRNFVLCEVRDLYAYVPAYESVRCVSCTVCVGTGSADTYHATSNSELARRIGASLAWVDGSHNLATDDPQAFARVALRFLADVRPQHEEES